MSLRLIRIQLVDSGTGKIIRSADTHSSDWMKITEAYDRIQVMMGAKATPKESKK